jgi:hypothetical protein
MILLFMTGHHWCVREKYHVKFCSVLKNLPNVGSCRIPEVCSIAFQMNRNSKRTTQLIIANKNKYASPVADFYGTNKGFCIIMLFYNIMLLQKGASSTVTDGACSLLELRLQVLLLNISRTSSNMVMPKKPQRACSTWQRYSPRAHIGKMFRYAE